MGLAVSHCRRPPEPGIGVEGFSVQGSGFLGLTMTCYHVELMSGPNLCSPAQGKGLL